MAALSGAFGTVSGEHTVRNWTVSQKRPGPIVYNSNSSAGAIRANGIQDWKGSFEQYTLFPTLFPGDKTVFVGYTSPDDGIPGNLGAIYGGDIIVSEISLIWDWRSDNAPLTRILFEADGNFAELKSAIPVDAVIPDPPSVCGLKIEQGKELSEGTEILWPNVASAELVFRIRTPKINSSETTFTASPGGGSVNSAFTKRTKGFFDFSITIVEDSTSLLDSISSKVGDSLRIKLFVDDTTFWTVEWAKIDSITDLIVDIESGRVIEQTVNLLQNSRANIEDEFEEGFIINPAGSVVWPFPPF